MSNNYLDALMQNHALASDSDSTTYSPQKGGAINTNIDVPTGGFPPIYMCDQVTKDDETTKNREYSSHKTAISIKDIMKKRRDTTPFVSV